MAKTFYTEREIEDLYHRGVTVLDVDDNVVLTDLARDKALSLGIRLTRVGASTKPAPSAAAPSPSQAEIAAKVKAAVIARLGNNVDPALLDAVIARVLAQIK
jgi:hypothetical protein